MKDDEAAFLVWKAFFSSVAKVDSEVFKWLLSLRPEVMYLHCPFVVLHEEKSFNGCTSFQLSKSGMVTHQEEPNKRSLFDKSSGRPQSRH
mgnify:CR=1 FL=1